jgi:hypothetical protein
MQEARIASPIFKKVSPYGGKKFFICLWVRNTEGRFVYVLGSEQGRDVFICPWVRARAGYVVFVLVQELKQDILCVFSGSELWNDTLCTSLGQRWRRMFCVRPRARARQIYIFWVFSGATAMEGCFYILEPELGKDIFICPGTTGRKGYIL